MQPEGGKAVGGARSLGGADVAGSVMEAELTPCVVLVGERTWWAKAVAAAGTSAEPVLPSEGTAKTEAKAGFGGMQNCFVAGTAIDGGDGGRYMSDEPPRRSRKVVNPHTWPMRAKIVNTEEA